jgi:hypothetical protein|tara:strand:- start:192 stop:416 length:225 start_codon:yes stop_codon:yes gene_type:complete
MIRLKIGSDGSQDIKKVCNVCKKTIMQDLQVEDVLVKPKWANSDNMTFRDKDGNEITRTELPNDLVNSVCEDCE